jgi:hypothetical protein
MKIYKPDLKSLIEESVQPVYMLGTTISNNHYIEFLIIVSGFNKEGRVLEYCTSVGSTFGSFDDEVKKLSDRSFNAIRIIEAELTRLGISFLPGLISDKRVNGDPFKIAKIEEANQTE